MRFPFLDIGGGRGHGGAPDPRPGPGPNGFHRLAELRPGERCVVVQIDGEPAIVRRLMELGLVPGTAVEFVRRAPLGDPCELRVRGTHLSIRRSEARQVHVELA